MNKNVNIAASASQRCTQQYPLFEKLPRNTIAMSNARQLYKHTIIQSRCWSFPLSSTSHPRAKRQKDKEKERKEGNWQKFKIIDTFENTVVFWEAWLKLTWKGRESKTKISLCNNSLFCLLCGFPYMEIETWRSRSPSLGMPELFCFPRRKDKRGGDRRSFKFNISSRDGVLGGSELF